MESISIFFDYIVKNELDEVKKYIENNNVDINCQDSEGVSGLCVACYHERFEIIQYLCEKGIDALIVSSRTGSSCLHYAIRTNNYEIIKYLINYNNKLVNICSKNGDSPLMFACVEGNYDVISLLLSEKADIKCISNNKLSAYHCLIQRKRDDKDICDILKLLKSCDESETISYCNGIGNTILHLCAERNYKNCIEYLLSLNFPERIRNKSGKTALDLCKGECKRILLDSWNKENKKYKNDNIIENTTNENINSLISKNKKMKKKSSPNKNNKISEILSLPPPSQLPLKPTQSLPSIPTELPPSPSIVIQPEIIMNENENISILMENSIPNCSILDIHYKHIFGKDLNELSICQLESLESFHLQVFIYYYYIKIK